MNRFLLFLLAFGIIFSLPVCELPEEEAVYRHSLRETDTEVPTVDDLCLSFDRFRYDFPGRPYS